MDDEYYDKPKADGSTVVCVKGAEKQLLHVTSLPGHYHDDCEYHDDHDDFDDDHNDCDDASHQSAWSSSS